MSDTFVGLDIETTGLEPSQGHRLIQFGIYFPNTGVKLVRDILPMGIMTLDPEAMQVNGFTLERIQEGTPNDEADVEIAEWLRFHNVALGSLTAVGFNVGWFDQHGFLKVELPETYKFFGRRSVDLTAITYLASAVSGVPRDKVKERIRLAVAKRMPETENWHDAGYDAEAAIRTLEYMQEQLKEFALEAAV